MGGKMWFCIHGNQHIAKIIWTKIWWQWWGWVLNPTFSWSFSWRYQCSWRSSTMPQKYDLCSLGWVDAMWQHDQLQAQARGRALGRGRGRGRGRGLVQTAATWWPILRAAGVALHAPHRAEVTHDNSEAAEFSNFYIDTGPSRLLLMGFWRQLVDMSVHQRSLL